MTGDPTIGAQRQPSDAASDEASREERHQRLAMMLAAYADQELPAETVSHIDAHLLGCSRCRRELLAHRAIAQRLETEPLSRASAALLERVTTTLAAAPVVRMPVVRMPVDHTRVARSRMLFRGHRLRVLVTLSAIAFAAALAFSMRAPANAPVPRAIAMVSLPSVALFSAVLADYRRVTALDLPGRARDLAAVRAALAFPVQPLSSEQLRLLAAWTTVLDGEPAAVLAYRWNDQLLLHYVVSEQLLFRPSEVRRAFATGHPMAASDGAQTVLAWPSRESGELLVGEATPAELVTFRRRTAPR